MKWQEKELKTIGELGDAVYKIIKEGTKEDAQEFMKLYSSETVHAYANVGYLSGYYDRETMDKIQDMFDTAHPVFGRSHPSPEEAFDLGRRMMQEEIES